MRQYYDALLKTAEPAGFVTPSDFLLAAVQYFQWCEENPLQEESLFHYKGEIIRDGVDKVRAFTMQGLAAFIGVSERRIRDLAKMDEDSDGPWSHALEMVQQVIYTQKFENAAAGLLNANLIARDLRLADRAEVTGKDGGPLESTIDVGKLSDGALEELVNAATPQG